MKILVVGGRELSSVYGGGEVYIRNLVAGLQANCHEVAYLFIKYENVANPGRVWTQDEQVKQLQLSLPLAWQGFGNPDHYTNRSRFVAEVCREISPDIIHAHAWKQIFSVAAKLVELPCIITAHHGGIVCPAGTLLNAEGAICRVAANEIDCLKCCVRAVPGWKVWHSFLRKVPLGLRLRVGKAIRICPFIPFVTPLGIASCVIRDKCREVSEIALNATAVIAPSPAIADALTRNGVPENKIVLVPHGIPLLERSPLAEGIGERPVRFIFVGRINYIKGLHVLLKACQWLDEDSYELHIVGSAATKPEKRYLKGLKKVFFSRSVIWYGAKNRHEILELLASCDLLVHPAIYLEVFGLSIAEALSVGRPVIATRCGGAEIQVRDGENGLLVQPNDPLSLYQAMQRFINDRDLVGIMAQQTGTVTSIESHLRILCNLYQSMRLVKS